MSEENGRVFKGVWIPAEVWNLKALTWMEKCVWAEISFLGTEEKPCYASNAYLAKFFESSEGSIANMISRLKYYGMIRYISNDGRQRLMLAILPDKEPIKIPRKDYKKKGSLPSDASRMSEGRVHERVKADITPECNIDTSIVTNIDSYSPKPEDENDFLNKSSTSPDRQNKSPEQPEGKVMSATAEQSTPPNNDLPPHFKYSADFETFWTAYPRKIGKQAAFKEWKRHKVDLSTALKAIDQQRNAGMFKEQQFIIYPERWIKNGRWEEVEAAPQLRVNAPTASSNPQAGPSCHRIKSEGLEDAFWNWFQTKRDWEERRNLRTVDDVWLDQFILSLQESEEF